jgi:hypothetical protein
MQLLRHAGVIKNVYVVDILQGAGTAARLMATLQTVCRRVEPCNRYVPGCDTVSLHPEMELR